MKKLSHLIFCLAITLMAFSVAMADAPKNTELAPEKVKELLKDQKSGIIIIDVRTPSEYRQGHLENARNMDFFGANFERNLADIPKDTPVLLYCKTGRRSANALQMLEQAGFTNAAHLKGGITAWEKMGGKIIREDQQPR